MELAYPQVSKTQLLSTGAVYDYIIALITTIDTLCIASRSYKYRRYTGIIEQSVVKIVRAS